MAIISTTALTAAETQFLDECRAAGECKGYDTQIAQMQKRLDELKKRRADAASEHQTVFAKVLTSKNIPIPQGATITRQKVNGADSLIVTK